MQALSDLLFNCFKWHLLSNEAASCHASCLTVLNGIYCQNKECLKRRISWVPLRPAPGTLFGEAVYCLTLILNWWKNGFGRREALFPLSIEPKEQLERENPKILSKRCQNTGKSGKKFDASLRNCRHGFDLSTFEKMHERSRTSRHDLVFQLLTSNYVSFLVLCSDSLLSPEIRDPFGKV